MLASFTLLGVVHATEFTGIAKAVKQQAAIAHERAAKAEIEGQVSKICHIFGLTASFPAPVIETKLDSLKTLAEVSHLAQISRKKIWVNTLDPVACCGLTDSLALANPQKVWGTLIS